MFHKAGLNEDSFKLVSKNWTDVEPFKLSEYDPSAKLQFIDLVDFDLN